MDSNTANAIESNTASTHADDFPLLGRTHPGWALFLVSVLGLFLELMLIRWISTEVRIFAYLQNTVLVVCFLGLGMGCFTCRKPIAIRQLLIPLLILVGCFAIPPVRYGLKNISTMLGQIQDFVMWMQGGSGQAWRAYALMAAGLTLTLMLMATIWAMFLPIGRLMGRLIDDHPRTIKAYSINVAGSLVGIWGFVLLSVCYQPPLTWLIVSAVLLLPFLGRPRQRRLNFALLTCVVGLSFLAGLERGADEVYWSPYQKLVLKDAQKDDPTAYELDRYLITVNNACYQGLIDLSEPAEGAAGDADPMRGYGQYDLPARLHPNPRTVLIVGAGSGNDAAGALRRGVKEVTAVEIDPAIIALGRKYHPEKPYDSPRVRVVTDDARSYFATCKEKFDVISFGLLDSHTLTSAMTNQRLDHFVYTQQSLAHAKTLLAEGGVLTLAFEPPQPFIADRLARQLREVFGQEPLAFRIPAGKFGWGGVFFVAGDLTQARAQIAADQRLGGLIAQWDARRPVRLAGTASITTDDWPYLYLQHHRVPVLYFLLAASLVAMLLAGQKVLGVRIVGRTWDFSCWHFFFLGAAFLLLEVQNISKASVVLGNTWWVNAVIISGVLTMILLANAVAAKFPNLPMKPVYVLLCGSCIALYFVDISRFAFLPFATKAVIVGALTTLPMFFSGIVFIRSFAQTKAKDVALGANLFGALVGGLLQSITFITGIKALLLVVAGLYLLALAAQRVMVRVPQTKTKTFTAPAAQLTTG